ncbi:hypothetical protein EJ04DRAFT_493636 [Polyplosphaeria fusca]|uniref:20S-pre-rRNA D-site endonuclease NOB1 n=1 Tax=Polyplosphaeria fusca TaxID=682080 RepID=A0A9P4R011_9PLEO|nr:hypothetical protein EJ04DRAFT_493636 [Polyplosphaeria fusca]
MAAVGQKPIHSLIVDTGPLIKNTVSISTILSQAEEIFTTPDILSEIRDAATRSRVETTLLPFLTVRTPAPKSYERVMDFSKRTGDYPVLSRQDMGILALAYEIECEKEGGDGRLRKVPGEPLRRPSMKKEDSTTLTSTESTLLHEQPVSTLAGEQTAEPASVDEVPTETFKGDSATKSYDSISPRSEPESPLERRESLTPEEAEPSDPDDDGDGEWITPSNLAQHQDKDAGIPSTEAAPIQMSVATMTTDFAMQNVLLQMNLHLLSPSLQRIRTLRTYILRCHACFLTTKQMDKQFCPRCGQPTLTRVSCTTNANGDFKLHLSKSHQWNNRGNRYSIPKPTAGTASGKHMGKGGGKGGWGKDLVLAEDQKEYSRATGEESRRKTRDLMDEDYLPGILSGDRGRAGGRPKVGAGRNVNSRKRF